MVRWFGSRVHPITPFDVEPAPVADLEKERTLQTGTDLLKHYVLKSERTVAATQQHFATIAADVLRR